MAGLGGVTGTKEDFSGLVSSYRSNNPTLMNSEINKDSAMGIHKNDTSKLGQPKMKTIKNKKTAK